MLMKHPDATEAVNVHPTSIEHMKAKGYRPVAGIELEVVNEPTASPSTPKRKPAKPKKED
jgi:hypothetical protein|tara:strand:- start:1178 stop:1357 length:180 start_codon:yes stop_codon:yes gene_type:complete